MEYIIRVRALVKYEWDVFLVQNDGRDFYSLPGGKHEWNEDMKATLKRELLEELYVDAEIWDLVWTNEFVKDWKFNLDLIYSVNNPEVFLNYNLEKASHSFELSWAWFFNLEKFSTDVKPSAIYKM